MLSRPQASLADFYREMGDLFGVELRPHNRWGGAKVLRERWQTHIDAALSRPVLLVDEAQEMQPAVLAELRLLSSAELDSPHPADRRARRRRPLARTPALRRAAPARQPHARAPGARTRHAARSCQDCLRARAAEGRRRQADDPRADRHPLPITPRAIRAP